MNLFKLFCFVLFISSVQTSNAQISEINTSLSKTESFYIPAVNGTKLAVDVHFPKGYINEKLPVLIELTRYWRSRENPETGEPTPSLRTRDNFFLSNEYILVKVDVRGTGASYGKRPGEYTPIEVQDAKYIVEWIVNQSWSNGSVGAYGTSYSGTTAELLCATGHKAIKAVIPGWSDFDIYESPGRPYGMLATSFVSLWSKIVAWLDKNDTDALKSSVRRVHDTFPSDAIAEHELNPHVIKYAKEAKYKDSKRFGEYTQEECSPVYWRKEISQSMVPMLVLTSWLDAGTAEGTLLRFMHFPNPQKVILMPTSHGGKSHASPYLVSDEVVDPVPTVEDQLQVQLDFFDHYLKNKDRGLENWPNIKYYNFGEEKFKESDVWPPKNQSYEKHYFHRDGKLKTSAPGEDQGFDEYEVNYAVSTGTNNRWTTQIGEDILNLHDRRNMDSLMLCYTSEPLNEDLQITGTPVMNLKLSSSLSEGAVFVYLEDIAPNGQSRYITEGGLLLEHRKVSESPLYDKVPFHSFKESDARPMPIDSMEEISFKLWPTSVLIRKGHSIRIAIAGTDKDTFDRVPETGTPTYKIYRNKVHLSFVDLPIIKDQ